MTRPTPEIMRETFSTMSGMQGYAHLTGKGYTVSREACRLFRASLRREGIVKDSRDIWDEKRLAKVRELAAKGYNAPSIAEELGTTKFAIHGVCQSRGIKLFQGRTLAIPSCEEVSKAFHKFTSMTAAANSLGVCEHTFRRWVKHYNLKRVATEKPPRAPKPRRKFGVTYTPTPVTPPTETGPLADAARYLRQQGYANVYRRGRDEWQVGARPMSEKEMLARVDEMKARRARMMGGVA